jgi:hypothetical protein
MPTDFAARSIKDLDAELAAGDISPEDYALLRDRYLASVLDLPETQISRRTRATWLTILAFVVVGIVAGVVVAQSSGQRLSRDSITGEIAPSSRTQLDDAQELSLTNPLDALKLYDEVIAQDPQNAEAIAYRNWTLYRALAGTEGTQDIQLEALDGLRTATQANPTYADAWAFRGVLELRVAEDAAACVQALDTFRQLIGPEASGSGVPIELVDSLYDEATQLLAQ